MQTYFDQVDLSFIERTARMNTPDLLAREAHKVIDRIAATELSLASIRAQGNWMLVNGQWHRKG